MGGQIWHALNIYIAVYDLGESQSIHGLKGSSGVEESVESFHWVWYLKYKIRGFGIPVACCSLL